MRYIIGLFVVIGLLFLVIFLLVRGNSGSDTPKTMSKPLYTYASTDSAVRLTVDGPINAVSQHQQIRITADSNNVTYEQLTGYDGQVASSQLFANTNSAYTNFLYALMHAGFSLGDNNDKLRDERGYCSTGQRYVYELIQDGRDVERYWSTSCGGTKTFLGSAGLVSQLFQAQVPNYSQLSESFNP